jgi:DNA-binding HxlR family transcriptional regulator
MTSLPVVAGRPCSVAAALELVGDRWTLLIVRELLFGNHRFSAIARNTGAPRDRLAARLKGLVADGLVEQREYQSNPPRSSYHLTDAGRELWPVLQVLREWGDKWAVAAPPVRIQHHDHELRIGTTCSVCGERVRTRDVTRSMRVPGWDLAGPTASTA